MKRCMRKICAISLASLLFTCNFDINMVLAAENDANVNTESEIVTNDETDVELKNETIINGGVNTDTENETTEEADTRANGEAQSISESDVEETVLATVSSDFEIEGTVLKKYKGNGGNVTIPNGITEIGTAAFEDCIGLQTITFSNSVTAVDSYAFNGCVGLRTVTLNQNLNGIGYYAFRSCSAIKNITIPASVVTIGDSAFENCTALTKLTLNNGLIEIGYSSFANTAINSLTIPETVTKLQSYAFANCKKLTKVSVPGSVNIIPNEAFQNCNSLSEISLGEGVTEIGDAAFERCSGLQSINLPNSLKTIKSYAFNGCKNLNTSLTKNIQEIGYRAFYDCEALSNVTIGSALKTIGDSAFYNTGIKSLSIPASVTDIGRSAFASCDNLINVTVNSAAISRYCFEDCTSLKSVIIGSGVTKIPSNCFNNCSSMTYISISNTVTVIDEGAMGGCSSLTEVYFPDSITSLGSWSFSYCKSLKKVVIPESVTSFGYKLFYDSPNVIIYGVEGSFAQDYADKNDITFVNASPVQPITASLNANKSGTIQVGTKVYFSATANGGNGTLKYKYLIQDASGKWAILRDYSPEAAFNWTASSTGKKTIYCDIKDMNGITVRKSVQFNVIGNMEVDLWSDAGATCRQGTKVTLAAKGKNGSGTYQYKFLIQDASGNWAILQNYSTNNKIVWTASKSGKKTLYVDVKDSTGKVVRKSKTVDVVGTFDADIWSDVGATCKQGTKVTLAAKGKNGSGAYKYKFLIQDASGNWAILQNYSANNKIIWNASKSGKKILYIDIKDSTGKVIRKSKTVNVVSNNVSTNLKVSSLKIDSYPAYVGSTINIKANATGGSGLYTYKFLMQDVRSGGWYMIQNFSAKSSAAWIPGGKGDKKIFVDVKDSTGKTVRAGISVTCY